MPSVGISNSLSSLCNSSKYLASATNPLAGARSGKFDNLGNNDDNFDSELLEAFPNPAMESVKFRFILPETQVASIKILNAYGVEIIDVFRNQKFDKGEHEYIFETISLGNGVYFYTLETEGFTSTKKLIITK